MRHFINIIESSSEPDIRIERNESRYGASTGEFSAYVNDEYAGSLSIGPHRSSPGYFSTMDVFVNPQFRNMKIATRLYNAAHSAGFAPIAPDQKLSPDGQAFWDAHQRKKVRLGKPLPPQEWSPVD